MILLCQLDLIFSPHCLFRETCIVFGFRFQKKVAVNFAFRDFSSTLSIKPLIEIELCRVLQVNEIAMQCLKQ